MKIFDEYCTPAMQNRLQQHPDFNEKLKDDPIKTMEAIEILIYNPVRVVYPLKALTDTLKNFLLTRHNKGESTIEYVMRRKQLGATVLQFLGKDFLENFMKTTEWYAKADDDERKNLLKQSPQLWVSYLMLENGEKETYGDLLEHLCKQYALGTDQFPKTTTSAADVMGAHEIQKENRKNTRKK